MEPFELIGVEYIWSCIVWYSQKDRRGCTPVGRDEEPLFKVVGPTVRDCVGVLHISNIFARWSFRGNNDCKRFSPEALKYLGRGEIQL